MLIGRTTRSSYRLICSLIEFILHKPRPPRYIFGMVSPDRQRNW